MLSMPAQNGLGPDDDQGLFPISAESGQKEPEDSIRLANSRPPVLSMKHRELLTECEVFECQFRPQPEGGPDAREQPQDREHHSQGVSDPTRVKSTVSMRLQFWRMTDS